MRLGACILGFLSQKKKGLVKHEWQEKKHTQNKQTMKKGISTRLAHRGSVAVNAKAKVRENRKAAI